MVLAGQKRKPYIDQIYQQRRCEGSQHWKYVCAGVLYSKQLAAAISSRQKQNKIVKKVDFVKMLGNNRALVKIQVSGNHVFLKTGGGNEVNTWSVTVGCFILICKGKNPL